MIVNNRLVIGCLLLLAVFWPTYILIPEIIVPYLLDVFNALGLTIGITVLWRYAPGSYLALKKVLIHKEKLTKGPLLVLGIELTWIAMVLRTVHIWEWRYFGEQATGLDTSVMAFAALLMVPGGACHLLASTMPYDNEHLPRLGTSMIAGAGICGVALGSIVALLRWYA